MFERRNPAYIPTLETIKEQMGYPLWESLCTHLIQKYGIQPAFDFSRCGMEYGWNVKFKKGSKSLCTLYPHEDCFMVMVVMGPKQKAAFKTLLPSLTQTVQKICRETQEGSGQQWLMIPLDEAEDILEDVKKLIQLRLDTL